MSLGDPRRTLRRLARAHGIQTGYVGNDHKRHAASDEALMGILRALGVDLERPEDAAGLLAGFRAARLRHVLEPVAAHCEGRGLSLTACLPDSTPAEKTWVVLRLASGEEHRWRLAELGVATTGSTELDGAKTKRWAFWIPDDRLTPGYHRLELEVRGESTSAVVVSAPRACPRPRRAWGLFAPVYALRSATDWGVGSFADLRRLGSWVGELGGGFTSTLPLCAVLDDVPFADASPYMPASRLAWNEAYIELESLPEMAGSSEAAAMVSTPAMQEELGRLRHRRFSDPRAVVAAKRAVLSELARGLCSGTSQRRDEFDAYAEARPEILAYARFRALCRATQRPFWDWTPEARESLRDPRDAGSMEDPEVLVHLYSQWVAEQQLGEGGRGDVGLHLDFPVGVHGAGFDPCWEPRSFARGASSGAPPDAFFAAGQVWGFPPLHPRRVREDGYRYFAAALRNSMRFASSLRIDHVMGLHRMYWVPDGFDGSDGAYVRYRADEMYAVVRLEAHLAGTAVVGEDLGTVPHSVHRAMDRHGLLRSFVLEFESTPSDPLPQPPELSIASIATHDLPTFASYWQGMDIVERTGRGALDESAESDLLAERAEWRRGLLSRLPDPPADDHEQAAGGLMDPRPGGSSHEFPDEAVRGNYIDREWTHRALDGCLGHLAAGPACLVVADLEDQWLEIEPQNRPGTGPEAGNFLRRARCTLEEVFDDPQIREVLSVLTTARHAREHEQSTGGFTDAEGPGLHRARNAGLRPEGPIPEPEVSPIATGGPE